MKQPSWTARVLYLITFVLLTITVYQHDGLLGVLVGVVGGAVLTAFVVLKDGRRDSERHRDGRDP
jgi:MFS superfamily sulfate permease-like transporter